MAASYAGKDFLIQDISSKWDGKYVNREDMQKVKGPVTMRIRYMKLTRIVMIEVTNA